ncbi:unnamed protein product [Closterium sp. Yama58-4]|nr:unnamed protein product [Closterium sp. Yama58-4]
MRTLNITEREHAEWMQFVSRRSTRNGNQHEADLDDEYGRLCHCTLVRSTYSLMRGHIVHVANDIEHDDDEDAANGTAGGGSGATTITKEPHARAKLGVVRKGMFAKSVFASWDIANVLSTRASGRVGDVNRGKGAYDDGAPETPRSLHDYGWEAAVDDGISDAVRALQAQFGDMKRALQDSNEAIKGLNTLVQQSLDLKREMAVTLHALQASVLPNAPVAPYNGSGRSAFGGSGSGSNDTEEASHELELKRAMASIMEPAKLSPRYMAVYLKCITEGDGTDDKGLSMWPAHTVVVQWSAATSAIREGQKEKLLYCLNHSAEHIAIWNAVAARMRGGSTRMGKTVLYRFLGIPRHVADMPKKYSMPWLCNEDGLPFSTPEFEIFIAAAYWRLLSRKVLRIHPYTLVFAFYGAEYPVVHHACNRADLPTTDTPNIHNTNRMRAIVVNWLRDLIVSTHGTPQAPRYDPEEVLIVFPPPQEAMAVPTEIVGPEMSDSDEEIPIAPTAPTQA